MIELSDINYSSVQKHILIDVNSSDIKEISKIIPSITDNHITKISDKVYELSPRHIKRFAPKLLDLIRINDLDNKFTRVEALNDFKNSTRFYAQSYKKFSIIKDDFSQLRNEQLYRGFYLIESNLRQLLACDEPLDKKPKNYRSKSLDHVVSQYTLSEFFEYYLLQPASDNFMKTQWGKSNKTDDDVIRVARLQKIDELELPLSIDELEKIRETRNKCMHFRAVSFDEYIEMIQIINKYLKIQSEKRLAETFNKFAQESLKPWIETLTNINKSMLVYFNQVNQGVKNIDFTKVKAFQEQLKNMNEKLPYL